MSDYQTEDGQPKYGVRLNPQELAVLREKQAREAEREREAKARRLAERRAKRRAAKRDFAAAEAEYVRRVREREAEREREAGNEGHFEHESLAGPEGLSDHEAGHGHEGQAGREGRSDHVYGRYDNITGRYSYWSDDKDRADREDRKSSCDERTHTPSRSAVREGYNVTNDGEPSGHYRLAPGGRFVYRAVPRKKKQRGRWRLFVIGVFMMLVVPMATLAGSVLYLTGGPGFFKAGQAVPESGQVALEAKTNYMLYSPLAAMDVDSCSVSDPAGKAVAYKEGSSQFPPGSFTSTTAGTYVIKCQNTNDTKVVGPPMHIERLEALSVVANLGFGVAIAGVWVTIVGWRRARAQGRK